MNKFMLFLVFVLAVLLNIDKADVRAAYDASADEWGYQVDLDVYTTIKAYDTIDA